MLPCPEQRRIPPLAGVRYYGSHSNVSWRKRKKRDRDELIASILDELVKSQKTPVIVIPVKTGIQENQSRRRSDGLGDFLGDHQRLSC